MLQPLIFCLVFTSPFFASANPISKNSLTRWWDSSVLYQIYPRSFMDADGDGIGDLAGIISKLEHVKEIADTVWLSPIYSSPQKDFGYDVSNYTEINPEYGTMEEFDELVTKAKSMGLRILMDFVPNHSSDQHAWFKKSVKRIKPYDEYYIWKDAKIASDGARLPPNNWLSFFTGSAWEWNEERGQYYLHQFTTAQPDLNYRSPLLQQEMKDVLKFWLDRGIDGFRIDAISLLFEDDMFRDEPRSNKAVPPTDYDFLTHIYTKDLDETYNVVSSWRKMMEEYSKEHKTDKKLMLMEVGSSLQYVMKYYFIDVDPFNFGFVHDLKNDSRAKDFRNIIQEWIDYMPEGTVANWVVGNHDVSRVASRFGSQHNRADQMSMLSVVLPGMAVVYNGDEIGMVDRFFTYEETVDPAGCNAGPERYQLKSRDPERTPYQWDCTMNAGFSTNPKTWLPVNDNYRALNLAKQKMDEVSHFKVFQALTKLKKSKFMLGSGTKVLLLTDNLLAVIRRSNIPEEEPVVLLINFDDDVIEVDVGSRVKIPKQMSVYTASVKSGLKTGMTVNTAKVTIPPASSVILASSQLVSALLNVV